MLTVFMKHAKNFVSKDSSRPLFTGVMFNGEYAIATDARICVAVPFKSEKRIINYKTGKDIEGDIPDIKKLRPTNIKCSAVIDRRYLQMFIDALKIMLSVNKHSTICAATFTEDGIKTHNCDLGDYIFKFYEVALAGKVSAGISFNCKYLLDALSFFKDTDCEQIQMRFPKDPLRPFEVESNGAFAVISLLRMAKE